MKAVGPQVNAEREKLFEFWASRRALIERLYKERSIQKGDRMVFPCRSILKTMGNELGVPKYSNEIATWFSYWINYNITGTRKTPPGSRTNAAKLERAAHNEHPPGGGNWPARTVSPEPEQWQLNNCPVCGCPLARVRMALNMRLKGALGR